MTDIRRRPIRFGSIHPDAYGFVYSELLRVAETARADLASLGFLPSQVALRPDRPGREVMILELSDWFSQHRTASAVTLGFVLDSLTVLEDTEESARQDVGELMMLGLATGAANLSMIASVPLPPYLLLEVQAKANNLTNYKSRQGWWHAPAQAIWESVHESYSNKKALSRHIDKEVKKLERLHKIEQRFHNKDYGEALRQKQIRDSRKARTIGR